MLHAHYVVLATGGLGGLYEHTTNYAHLTGDALGIALKHKIAIQNINYIQIHPTTLYSKKPGRRFLISESVRGEGAVLYNSKMERFTDELLPRDLLTNQIHKQMEQDGSQHVWLSIKHLDSNVIKKRFPNIYQKCLEEGYDITRECIPVTPAQHYFMGGIQVDLDSKTSMEHLYAVGETSCNGVHGANRLASNSLLESLVFAKRSAHHITANFESHPFVIPVMDWLPFQDLEQLHKDYCKKIRNEIERINQYEQSYNHEVKCG
jgi:L-aspartate oxidase